jgi:hypothetical protein
MVNEASGDIYSMCAYCYLERCDPSEENAKKGMKYLEKSRDTFKRIGDDEGVISMENRIHNYRYLSADSNDIKTPQQLIQPERKLYEMKIKLHGEVQAIKQGSVYVYRTGTSQRAESY